MLDWSHPAFLFFKHPYKAYDGPQSILVNKDYLQAVVEAVLFYVLQHSTYLLIEGRLGSLVDLKKGFTDTMLPAHDFDIFPNQVPCKYKDYFFASFQSSIISRKYCIVAYLLV